MSGEGVRCQTFQGLGFVMVLLGMESEWESKGQSPCLLEWDAGMESVRNVSSSGGK